jgi:hypothetical protein
MVSPGLAEEQAIAAERDAHRRQMNYDLERSRLAEQERAYGPDARGERATAAFVVEQNPELFAGAPRDVMQSPKAIMNVARYAAGQQQPAQGERNARLNLNQALEFVKDKYATRDEFAPNRITGHSVPHEQMYQMAREMANTGEFREILPVAPPMMARPPAGSEQTGARAVVPTASPMNAEVDSSARMPTAATEDDVWSRLGVQRSELERDIAEAKEEGLSDDQILAGLRGAPRAVLVEARRILGGR